MHTTTVIDTQRRRFLVAASTAVGGVGLIATAVPFVAALNPSARAKAAGGPVTADISKLESGQHLTVEWRGKPVWLLHRQPAMLQRLQLPEHLTRLRDPDSGVASQQPLYAQNPYRSRKPDLLVIIGVCTHLGCIPSYRPDVAVADLGPTWIGGYFCPCHGSRFDLAGRVFKQVPAPTNLVVPPHHYLSDTLLEIGVDESST